MKSEIQHFSVSESDAGTRLDRFLVACLGNASRGAIQRHIEAGRVTVNGKPRTPHYALRAGEEVVAEPLIAATDRLHPLPATDLRVVWEDEAIAVIEKPSGILTHPTESSDEPTVVHFLLSRYPQIKGVGEDPLRPGIVHRLDRDVSGLLIVAKTPEAFAALKEQFQNRTILKEYAAVVFGRFGKPAGDIALPISRSKGHRAKMAARPLGSEGREAKTHFTVLAQNNDYAFLHLRPETGRMHQIRVHLQAVGHPVVGDALYGRKRPPVKSVDRILLHCVRLGFRDLAGQWRESRSPLPDTLANFLRDTLKADPETLNATIDPDVHDRRN